MMNEEETYFIDDPGFKDRKYLLDKVDSFVDPLNYRKKVFLRDFVLELIRASRPKEARKIPNVEIRLKPVPKLPQIDLNSIRSVPSEIKEPVMPVKEHYEQRRIMVPVPKPDKIYPVKTFPYPKPTPLYQLKPIIKRNLLKKKLPFLKSKSKDVFVEEGKLYYSAKINNKTYLDQVKSIINDPRVSAMYCDGVNKPLYVDYLNYSQILTKIGFSDKNRLNNMIKKFSEENGIRISNDKPVILEKLKNGIIFQASLGSDFIEPRFIIKKGKIL